MSYTIAVKSDNDLIELKEIPYIIMNEKDFFNKLEISRNHAKLGFVRNADDVINDMRQKYRF